VRPLLSWPLKTFPKPPTPMRFPSLKFLVARTMSWYDTTMWLVASITTGAPVDPSFGVLNFALKSSDRMVMETTNAAILGRIYFKIWSFVELDLSPLHGENPRRSRPQRAPFPTKEAGAICENAPYLLVSDLRAC